MPGIKNFYSRNFDGLLPRIRDLNSKNISASISFLPQSSRNETEVQKNVTEYKKTLHSISKENIKANVTVKPNQLGIYFDKKLAQKALQEIAECAKELNNFVWLDMEIIKAADETLEIFHAVYDKYPNIGICLQTCHDRTEKDMQKILEKKAPLRLVKGYYNDYDIYRWSIVTEKFGKFMNKILLESSLPAIATHDHLLIAEAKKIIQENKITNAELQFFDGVCNDETIRAAEEGFNVRSYVAYGNLFSYLKDVIKKVDMSRALQRIIGFKKIL